MKKLILLAVTLLFASTSYAYYQAEQGRWMSRDPIGERGGVNVYGFVHNRAVDKIDVLGEKPCCNGQEYASSSQCCCCNGRTKRNGGAGCKLVDKEKVASGVVVYTRVGPYDKHAGRHYVHVWLEWSGGSADANAVGARRMHSPALGRGSYTSKEEKMISPCKYDLEKLNQCLTTRTTPCPPEGVYVGQLCYDYSDDLFKKCLKSSKGCRSQ